MPSLRKWLGRLGASTDEITWEDRRRLAASEGADRLIDSADRQRVVIRGTIETLTIRPREDTSNWLEARLGDGTGTVTLIWMGRHEIPGIEAGREMRVEGRISLVDGVRRIYNPEYTLL